MKTITKTIKLYSIEELAEHFPETYAALIEKRREELADDLSYYYSEVMDTLNAAAGLFGLYPSRDYSIGIYSISYVFYDTEDYMSLSNAEKNEIVSNVNEFKAAAECNLTGVCYDYYLLDYLTEYAPNGVTYNDIHKHITAALDYVLSKCINDIEEMIEDDNYVIESIDEVFFDEDGEPYDE